MELNPEYLQSRLIIVFLYNTNLDVVQVESGNGAPDTRRDRKEGLLEDKSGRAAPANFMLIMPRTTGGVGR